MIRKMTGVALVVMGDMGLIIGLAADPMGLGEGHAMGYKQISLVAFSIFVQLVGLVLSQVEGKFKGIVG